MLCRGLQGIVDVRALAEEEISGTMCFDDVLFALADFESFLFRMLSFDLLEAEEHFGFVDIIPLRMRDRLF